MFDNGKFFQIRPSHFQRRFLSFTSRFAHKENADMYLQFLTEQIKTDIDNLPNSMSAPDSSLSHSSFVLLYSKARVITITLWHLFCFES